MKPLITNKTPLESNLPQKAPRRWTVVLTIAASTIGASLISWFALIHQSIRLDESQSIWQSSHSITGLLHTVALDVHVPLYHLILHVWIFYFGQGIVTIRLLSLLFFLLTIPVVYLLSRQLLSRRWSLLAVVLFSFSPFLNWYGNEARMYTLLLLVSALNQLFFLRILKTGKGWFWFGLTAIVGVYSHYFFLFNLVSEAGFFLFNRRHFQRGSLTRLSIVAILSAAALSPWLYFVYSLGSASTSRPTLPSPSTVDFFNVFSQFLFGFQSNFVNTLFLSCWPVLMLLGLVAVRRSKGITPQLSFMATMAVLPIVLAYGISLLITPFFLSRYMVIAVTPLLIALVYMVSKFSRQVAAFGVAVLLVLTTATSTLQATSSMTPVKENYRQVAADIDSQITPQDVVVLSAPFTIYPFEYYYRGSAQIATLPLWNRAQVGAIPPFDAAKLPQQVAALNQNHRYIYLVLSQDQGYEKTISQYYLTHFKQLSQREYSPGLTLYVYQVGYYTVPAIDSAAARQPLQ